MDIKDLKPKKAFFKLSVTNKKYYLRPINLEDEIWLAETFGNEIAKIFTDMNMIEISRIVYHQLVDKTPFKKQEVIIHQEDGSEKKETLGGVDLLRRLIHGLPDKLEIINALNETIGISRSQIEESDGQKKKRKWSLTGRT